MVIIVDVVERIRRVLDDNLGIIFVISQKKKKKCMLWVLIRIASPRRF